MVTFIVSIIAKNSPIVYLFYCRLEAYDRNFNFGQVDTQSTSTQIEISSADSFRDINATSVLPDITKHLIQAFFYRQVLYNIILSYIVGIHCSYRRAELIIGLLGQIHSICEALST